jgi:hypothetical protein
MIGMLTGVVLVQGFRRHEVKRSRWVGKSVIYRKADTGGSDLEPVFRCSQIQASIISVGSINKQCNALLGDVEATEGSDPESRDLVPISADILARTLFLPLALAVATCLLL